MENIYAFLIFFLFIFIGLYLVKTYYSKLDHFINRTFFYQQNIDEIKRKMESLDHFVNSQKIENKSYRYV